MRKAYWLGILALSAAGLSGAGLSGAAQAVTITGSAVGSWSNVQGTSAGSVYSISNNDAVATPTSTATFSFGSGLGTPPNSFTFNGVGSGGGAGFTTALETPFDIGHFTYFNGNTNNYPDNSSVSLGIALTITSPILATTTFTYNFGIDITPNLTGNPVLDGDTVSITNGLTSTTLTVDGTAYTLMLNGFSTDGGKTYTSSFESPEGSTAQADVYATITTHTQVPEPASLVLFGSGLVGLRTMRRRVRGAVR